MSAWDYLVAASGVCAPTDDESAGDEAVREDNRYRHLADRHGFEGHIDWSEAMLP